MVAEEDDPVRDLVRILGESNLVVIKAPKTGLRQTRELGKRVLELYGRAYPERLGGIDVRGIEGRVDAAAESHIENEISPMPRKFVRSALELLDVAPDLTYPE